MRRDLIGREMVDGSDAARARSTRSTRRCRPGYVATDILVVLAFGLVIGLGFRKIVKDGEPLGELSPDAPPEPPSSTSPRRPR